MAEQLMKATMEIVNRYKSQSNIWRPLHLLRWRKYNR